MFLDDLEKHINKELNEKRFLTDAKELIQTVKGLEGKRKELEKGILDLAKDHEAALVKADEAKADVKQILMDADDLVKKKKARAEKDADALLAKAKDDANDILGLAKAELEKNVEKNKELLGVQSDIDDANKVLADLRTEIERIRKEKADLVALLRV